MSKWKNILTGALVLVVLFQFSLSLGSFFTRDQITLLSTSFADMVPNPEYQGEWQTRCIRWELGHPGDDNYCLSWQPMCVCTPYPYQLCSGCGYGPDW